MTYNAKGVLMHQLSRVLVGRYQGEDLVLTCRYIESGLQGRRVPEGELLEIQEVAHAQ